MGFIFPYKSKIIKKDFIRTNLVRVSIEKPYGYNCNIGQMIDLSIDKPGFGLEVESYTIAGGCRESFFDILVKQYAWQDKVSAELAAEDINLNLLFSSPWFPLQYKGSGLFIVEDTYIPQIIYMFKEQQYKIPGFLDHRLLVFNEDQESKLFEREIKDILGRKTGVQFYSNTEEIINHKLVKKQIRVNRKKIHIYGSYEFERKIKESIKTAK